MLYWVSDLVANNSQTLLRLQCALIVVTEPSLSRQPPFDDLTLLKIQWQLGILRIDVTLPAVRFDRRSYPFIKNILPWDIFEPRMQFDLRQGLISLGWFLSHHLLNEVIDEISVDVVVVLWEGDSVMHDALIHEVHVTVVERRQACQHLKQEGT